MTEPQTQDNMGASGDAKRDGGRTTDISPESYPGTGAVFSQSSEGSIPSRPPEPKTRVRSKCFDISIEMGGDFTIEEIWPDGNAPTEPTIEDVIAVLRESGPLHRLLTDWGFEDGAIVSVNGQNVPTVLGRIA